MFDLGIVALGLLIGLISGATGIGGGTLLAPFLMFVLKIDPFTAVGTDLVTSFVTKAVGSVVHRRENNIDRATLIPVCVGGLAGAIAGTFLLMALKSHYNITDGQHVLRRAIGVALALSAVAIGLPSMFRSRRSERPATTVLGAIGAVVGAITTTTGVGVGALTVPALYLANGELALRRVVGTTIVFATVVTAVGTVLHVGIGDVNYRICLLLLCGSCPGVVLGSMLSGRISNVLKPAIVVLLIISGARLIA